MSKPSSGKLVALAISHLTYSQIVTPGYLVIISAAGKQLEYHADSRGRIVFRQEF